MNVLKQVTFKKYHTNVQLKCFEFEMFYQRYLNNSLCKTLLKTNEHPTGRKFAHDLEKTVLEHSEHIHVIWKGAFHQKSLTHHHLISNPYAEEHKQILHETLYSKTTVRRDPD